MISTICDAEMENLHVRIESRDREEKDGREKKKKKSKNCYKKNSECIGKHREKIKLLKYPTNP